MTNKTILGTEHLL